MLRSLEIVNYAIIESLHMELDGGLNVLTGETGAGKSILMGALGLTLGDRADTSVLRNAEKTGYVEAVHDVPDALRDLLRDLDVDAGDVLTVRRTILPSGRSRTFINDVPVALKDVRRLGDRLVNRHDQHETLRLKEADFQLQVVDAVADHPDLLRAMQEAHAAWRAAEDEHRRLVRRRETLADEADYRRFQLKEIEEADLDGRDLDEMEGAWSVLENAESIRAHLNAVLERIRHPEAGIEQGLTGAATDLRAVASFAAPLTELADRLESLRIELVDLEREVEHELESTEVDEEGGAELRDRLDAAHRLLKKHRCTTISELMAVRDALRGDLSETDDLDGRIESAAHAAREASERMNAVADQLTGSRTAVFDDIRNHVLGTLGQVGMANADFVIDRAPAEVGAWGADAIAFRFTANPGFEPRDIAEVASGGELSRLMLSIKAVLAGRVDLPTLIFDEIDTGISGEVASRVGSVIHDMARRHQIIAITHLPQIAARGDRHFFIHKSVDDGRTATHVDVLTPDERIDALARMLSGAQVSGSAVDHARSLLNQTS